MSDFKWEDVLNPSKVEQGLEGMTIDPRNGEPIKDSAAKRQELEDLLKQVPKIKSDQDAVPPVEAAAPPIVSVPPVFGGEAPKEDDKVFAPVANDAPSKPAFENPPIKLDWDEEPKATAEATAPPITNDGDGFVPPIVFETKEESPMAFAPEPELPPVAEEKTPEPPKVSAPPIMEVIEGDVPASAPPVSKIDLSAFGVELPKAGTNADDVHVAKASNLKLSTSETPEVEESGISWDKPDFSGLPGQGGDARTPFGAKVGAEDPTPTKLGGYKGNSPVDPSILSPVIEKQSHKVTDEEEESPFHIVSSEAPFVHDYHMDELLRQATERRASDIHFTVGLPPMVRVDGDLVPLNYQPLRPADTRRLIYDTLGNEQLEKFERTHELDFGYMVKGLARFRFNVYMQRGSVAGALRLIPNKIPSFETLNLPEVIKDLSKRTSGLVLVTGPTGSGKSTTIASMIDDINETRNEHIMTIEDPIEYLHNHKKSMVNQREMHADTYSFHDSLRAVLREDPDIILVGELRDLETIEAALTLAETGHLVFGTLHTRNAPASIDRIIDVFSADQQAQIRVLLGNTLEAVVSQQLLSRQGGGRSAALEIMIGTPAIKNLIREGKTHQMYSIIETSKNIGMQTMDWSLSELYRSGKCSYEDCLAASVDKETFIRLAKGAA